ALLSSLLTPRPPLSTRFPYTTLFRSFDGIENDTGDSLNPYFWIAGTGDMRPVHHQNVAYTQSYYSDGDALDLLDPVIPATTIGRSEEHTSELQSRENLVCRLLLEKKK